MWHVTDVLSTILAVGALLLQVVLAVLLLIALASLFSPGARRLLVEIRETLLGSELWIAWALAAIATLGSLYYSEIADYLPCRLCWFQRIAMYPLAVVLLVAAVRRDARGAFAYAIALPVIGILISGYHIAVEIWPSIETQGCKAGGGSCAVKWIEELGYVTIPVLAATAFAAIIALLLFARSRAGAERE
jgi:disulfide bond formation protein DsbB